MRMTGSGLRGRPAAGHIAEEDTRTSAASSSPPDESGRDSLTAASGLAAAAAPCEDEDDAGHKSRRRRQAFAWAACSPSCSPSLRCTILFIVVVLKACALVSLLAWYGSISEAGRGDELPDRHREESVDGSRGIQPLPRSFTDVEAAANSAAAKRRRALLSKRCSREDLFGFIPPAPPWLVAAAASNTNKTEGATAAAAELAAALSKFEGKVVRCRNVILDLGSNKGDTVGRVLDSALPSCPPPFSDADRPTFDLDALRLVNRPERRRGESTYAQPEMERFLRAFVGFRSSQDRSREGGDGGGGPPLGLEDYCVYGVEGNPRFAHRLKALEYHIMANTGNIAPGTNPRPPPARLVRHLHFFVDTVAAGTNGPTDLFLETLSADAVGSSLLWSHAVAAKNGIVMTKVHGVTLTTMLRRILLPHSEGGVSSGSDNVKGDGGGHLILKVDIEGGEYAVLEEALKSGILCDLVRGGYRIDLVIEWHLWVISDEDDKARFKAIEDRAKKELRSCGVKIYFMTVDWK